MQYVTRMTCLPQKHTDPSNSIKIRFWFRRLFDKCFFFAVLCIIVPLYAKVTETPPNFAFGTPISYSACFGFDRLSVVPNAFRHSLK